jgi:peptidyl-prolyl cis-trans isomerase C
MERILVNGAEIPATAVAAEMQYHPAASREQAWNAAANALVIRHLLLREAARLGIALDILPTADSDGEEATIQALLEREVSVPEPDGETCRRYWSANQAKFSTPDLYEAAHILFLAAPDDGTAREAAKQAAGETIALLQADPASFATLARERSACPSGASGGLLGQQNRGDLVPELETFVMAMEEGQTCPIPVATRYGYHVLRLDRLIRGSILPFETAAPLVSRHLMTQSWQRAVSQYLRILTGRARIEGLAIAGASSPLVQ